MFKGLIIAFSMYSKIPMPIVKWEERNMKYVMCYFPMVGLVIGFIYYFLFSIMKYFNFNHNFITAFITILPVLITGGIHVDGFIDVIDALHSYGDRQKKLEILKDPHIGAFAIIYAIIYYIALFGIYSNVNIKNILIISLGFIISRSFSAFLLVTLKSAKKNGLLASFSKDADKKIVKIVNIIYILLCFGFILYKQFIMGLICIIVSSFIILYYKTISYKEFGGITGDLAGYFLQIYELVWGLIVVVFIR